MDQIESLPKVVELEITIDPAIVLNPHLHRRYLICHQAHFGCSRFSKNRCRDMYTQLVSYQRYLPS
jgi:hypothetical protein